MLAALVLQFRGYHRLDEWTRTGPPLCVGGMRLAPIPDATVPWMLP